MFTRMIQFWKRGCEARENLESAKREILGEIEGIKKTLRRQNLSLEAVREDILAGIGEKTLKDANPLLEIIESFFFFDSSLRDLPGFPPSQIEAAEMVWKKFDSLLSDFGLEIIRQTGISFDPRLHETVEKPPEMSGGLVITRILRPGYLCRGQVARAAKVILGTPPQMENGAT